MGKSYELLVDMISESLSNEGVSDIDVKEFRDRTLNKNRSVAEVKLASIALKVGDTFNSTRYKVNNLFNRFGELNTYHRKMTDDGIRAHIIRHDDIMQQHNYFGLLKASMSDAFEREHAVPSALKKQMKSLELAENDYFLIEKEAEYSKYVFLMKSEFQGFCEKDEERIRKGVDEIEQLSARIIRICQLAGECAQQKLILENYLSSMREGADLWVQSKNRVEDTGVFKRARANKKPLPTLPIQEFIYSATSMETMLGSVEAAFNSIKKLIDEVREASEGRDEFREVNIVFSNAIQHAGDTDKEERESRYGEYQKIIGQDYSIIDFYSRALQGAINIALVRAHRLFCIMAASDADKMEAAEIAALVVNAEVDSLLWPYGYENGVYMPHYLFSNELRRSEMPANRKPVSILMDRIISKTIVGEDYMETWE